MLNFTTVHATYTVIVGAVNVSMCTICVDREALDQGSGRLFPYETADQNRKELLAGRISVPPPILLLHRGLKRNESDNQCEAKGQSDKEHSLISLPSPSRIHPPCDEPTLRENGDSAPRFCQPCDV